MTSLTKEVFQFCDGCDVHVPGLRALFWLACVVPFWGFLCRCLHASGDVPLTPLTFHSIATCTCRYTHSDYLCFQTMERGKCFICETFSCSSRASFFFFSWPCWCSFWMCACVSYFLVCVLLGFRSHDLVRVAILPRSRPVLTC